MPWYRWLNLPSLPLRLLVSIPWIRVFQVKVGPLPVSRIGLGIWFPFFRDWKKIWMRSCGKFLQLQTTRASVIPILLFLTKLEIWLIEANFCSKNLSTGIQVCREFLKQEQNGRRMPEITVKHAHQVGLFSINILWADSMTSILSLFSVLFFSIWNYGLEGVVDQEQVVENVHIAIEFPAYPLMAIVGPYQYADLIFIVFLLKTGELLQTDKLIHRKQLTLSLTYYWTHWSRLQGELRFAQVELQSCVCFNALKQLFSATIIILQQSSCSFLNHICYC